MSKTRSCSWDRRGLNRARAASATVAEAEKTGIGLESARTALELSEYYEAARLLAHRLTEWSKNLAQEERRFVICTGGGPGIMEAANRGASEAKGHNVGLTISIPNEKFDNPYVSRELHIHFHYFFMRKFWFVYLAKAVVLFPGGFGTLDELFEILTLVQTRKMRKRIPIDVAVSPHPMHSLSRGANPNSVTDTPTLPARSSHFVPVQTGSCCLLSWFAEIC
jgi:uncharacterized protein (TIGR00730 family)